MATSIIRTKPRGGASGTDGGAGLGFGGNGDISSRRRERPRPNSLRLAVFFGLTGIGMLFVALTSAYIVRRGAGSGWEAIRMPRILWFNTAALLASSLALEKARRGIRRGLSVAALERWTGIALSLGSVFLAGQIAAWRNLEAQGIFLSTNPHSSFFYLLTGLHGLHVVGGLAALAYLLLSLGRTRGLAPRFDAISMYWHFMFGLWVYLFVLLFGGI